MNFYFYFYFNTVSNKSMRFVYRTAFVLLATTTVEKGKDFPFSSGRV
jgi:hypothetical protein